MPRLSYSALELPVLWGIRNHERAVARNKISVHSFNKHLLDTYCVPGAGDTAKNKTDES